MNWLLTVNSWKEQREKDGKNLHVMTDITAYLEVIFNVIKKIKGPFAVFY